MTLTVDLHHNVIPDFYWEASSEEGSAAGGGVLGASAARLIPRLAGVGSATRP
jgi:hypothetical protein